MNWGSPLYRLWVIGGMIGIVAFAIIGGFSDPTNQDFVLYLIPAVAVYMAGILFLQWRGKAGYAPRSDTGPAGPIVRWQIGYAAVLCACIFGGVFAFYAGVDETLYPLGEAGPGLPLVLVPAVVLVFFGAARTLWFLR